MNENEKDFIPEGDVDISIESDFSVEEEYEPSPLIPNGANYRAAVTETKFDIEQQAIVFGYTLHDNGGVMSDGKTTVDGQVLIKKIWLPKAGDENEITKDGRTNKRKAKINMMRDFAKKMKISLENPVTIMTALRNQDWVGLEVILKINASQWEGTWRNEIKDVKAV